MKFYQNKSLVYFITAIFFSFLSYLKPIYEKYYSLVLFLTASYLMLSFLSYFFKNRNKKDLIFTFLIRYKWLLLYFLFFLIFNALHYFSGRYTSVDFLRNLSIILSFLLILIIANILIEKEIIIFNFFNILIIFSSIFGNLSFLLSYLGIYEMTYDFRVSSFFFDPNYYAALLAISFLFQINYHKSKFLSFYLFVSLLLTGSRGIIFSLVLSYTLISFFKLLKKDATAKNSISRMFLLISSVFVFFLLNPKYIRVHQKWGNRDVLWQFGIKNILRKPFDGYGYEGFKELFLNEKNLWNMSTHNGYLDFILINGIIPFVLIEFILLFNFWKLLRLSKKKNIDSFNFYAVMVIFLSIAKLTINFNLGGLGLLSFMYTYIHAIFLSRVSKY